MFGPLPICPCGTIRQLIEYAHTLFRKTGNHSDGAENREHYRPLWRSPLAYSIRAYQSPLKNRNGERLFCLSQRVSSDERLKAARMFCRADIMQFLQAHSVSEILSLVFDVIRRDRICQDDADIEYYFRGDEENFLSPGAFYPAETALVPTLFREPKLLEHESDIFNEVLRTFPLHFKDDGTTFEILTRMLDVTPKVTTALGMVIAHEQNLDHCGFIHVFRVARNKIKYSTGDTVTALSNLARLKNDHVRIGNLKYLAYECQNERAGFHWEEEGRRANDFLNVSLRLDSDIGKVWCVKPVINNIRIDVQKGVFFIFGCNDRKEKLRATFDEVDYLDKASPTCGIARIGVMTICPQAKREAYEMKEFLDIEESRIYPDFEHHARLLKEKFGGQYGK